MDSKVKPWFQSVSLWIALVAAIVGAVIATLTEQGVVGQNATWVVVALAVVSVLKRMVVESADVKGAHIVEGMIATAKPEQPKDPS